MVSVEISNFNVLKKTLMTPEKFKKKMATSNDKAFFSFNYTKYGSYSNWTSVWQIMNNLPATKNIFHELITENFKVKPYFDIEWYKEEFPNLDPDDVLNDIKNLIVKIFKDEIGYELNKKDIYVASCHRVYNEKQKCSFRIVVSTHSPMIVFENTNQAFYLAKRIRELSHDLFDPSIIDVSVYKKIQNLRLVGHCKDNDLNHPMKKVRDYDNDLEFVVTNVDKEICLIDTVEEQSDELYKDIQNLSNIEPDKVDLILQIITKKYHKTAYIESIDSNNFIQLNYTDRLEQCFCSNIYHDKIGFFCYVYKDFIYLGCHSGRCINPETGKKIIVQADEKLEIVEEIGYEEVSDKKLFNVNCLSYNFKKECIVENLFGMTNLLEKMYSAPQRIRWLPDGTRKGSLYYWDGKLWRHDLKGFYDRLITVQLLHVLTKFRDESSQICNPDAQENEVDIEESVSKLICRIQNLDCVRTISSHSISLFNDEFFDKVKDTKPYLLCCNNGVVDLKTGKLRNGIPEDNLTKCLDIDYKEDADDSIFDNFVRQITSSESGPDNELYNYVRWSVGYSLQGSPDRKIFYIFLGEKGYNGKSLFLNTIKEILQFYAVSMDKSVVVQGPKKTSGAHSTEICQLENSRLGILSETQESDVINDSQMKVLTGLTDTMSIREIYGRQKEMKPLFVPFISSNHKLQINLDDNAMFERLVLIPFRLSFVNKPDPTVAWQRKGDEKLSEKFRANKEGILKWIVDCSNFYHKTGDISLPRAVVDAKKSYKYEMDSYQQFVDEMIVVEVGAVCKLKDILPVYKDYVNSRLITCNLKKARTKLAFLLEKYSIQKETYSGIYVKEQ